MSCLRTIGRFPTIPELLRDVSCILGLQFLLHELRKMRGCCVLALDRDRLLSKEDAVSCAAFLG
jgi:hypothetical protein